ncbi:MAG: putative toxin-antitoxin system toxin component, PIN family [Candidatus Omnitrophica bacterium]|nr:putative toxin-antitoxin system toxin component, PIN family [Candidatus Omnitrophota bacterium]
MKSDAIRVVIDTNVFISAVLFKGESAKLLELWKKPRLKFLICKEVLEEYIKALSYPKFKLSEEEIKYILEEELLPFIDPVNITSEVDIIKEDNADNKFIALAIDGNANCIISGDAHLLKLKKFQGIGIVSVKEFLSRF